MTRISGIKAISFDADGTLWDFEKVMRHSLHEVLLELESIDPEARVLLDIDTMIAIRDRVFDDLSRSVTNLEVIRLEAFKRTLQHIRKPNEAVASHLNQVYLKHRFEDIELFDDVIPTLTALRQKYTIGLLSNGNTLPERCGLAGVFAFVVFSQQYGVRKPDPRIFHIALEKAGCSRHELVHVGDSVENDIFGAGNAGIKGVWLNRSGAQSEHGVEAGYEISSLSKLLEIL